MHTRKPVFAGSWYPGDAKSCEREIKSFLKNHDRHITEKPPVGGITPHAGWYFSGEIACRVIHSLQTEQDTDLFIVFGMHLSPYDSNYIMTSGSWETPFGLLEIERQLADKLNHAFRFQSESAASFPQDNTIELQLPFIKYFFKKAKIVPIGVAPNADAVNIGQTAARLAQEMGFNTKIIGSTDLTHYGFNYGFTPRGTGTQALQWVKTVNDQQFIDAVLALDDTQVIKESLANHNACCSGAVAAAIGACKTLGAGQAQTVAYATSYDKSPGDSFVGYVGVLFY